jgi:hypothetical protein
VVTTASSGGDLVPAFRREVLTRVLWTFAASGQDVDPDTRRFGFMDRGEDYLLAPGLGTWHEARPDRQPVPSTTLLADPLAAVFENGLPVDIYVQAPPDVEQADPDRWVVVGARRIVPARLHQVIVKAGQVALYEDQSDAYDACPADLGDDEEWLPYCRHCGRPLITDVPGMYYPFPDERPYACPRHPDRARPRPCAAAWELSNFTTGRNVRPGPDFEQRRQAARTRES